MNVVCFTIQCRPDLKCRSSLCKLKCVVPTVIFSLNMLFLQSLYCQDLESLLEETCFYVWVSCTITGIFTLAYNRVNYLYATQFYMIQTQIPSTHLRKINQRTLSDPQRCRSFVCFRVHMHPLFEIHFWYIWKYQKIEKKSYVYISMFYVTTKLFHKNRPFIWSM
jgi:hypothetical protein